MAYAYVWDTAAPVGTDLVSDGARVIREDVKGALNERLLTVFVNLTSEPLKYKDLTTDHNTYDLGKTAARFRDAWLSRNLTVAGTTVVQALTATTGSFTGATVTVTTAGSSGLIARTTDTHGVAYTQYQANSAALWSTGINVATSTDAYEVYNHGTVSIALSIAKATNIATFVAGITATTGTFSDNLGTATGKKLGLNAGLTTYLYEESAGVIDCYLTGLHRSRLDTTNFYTPGGVYLIGSLTALTNGAAAQVATLTNGPVAGNPTKWFKINDGGTDRYMPAW